MANVGGGEVQYDQRLFNQVSGGLLSGSVPSCVKPVRT
jgi:hypothetical protein